MRATLEEVSRYLRDLSDQLAEAGAEDEDDQSVGASLADFHKIKLSLKKDPETDEVRVKMKVTYPDNSNGQGNGDKAKKKVKKQYKALKKRMKKTFKEMAEFSADQTFPDREAFNGFISDCRLMVSYHGFGDEYYDAYMKAVYAMVEAFDRQDTAGFWRQFAEVDRIRADCHDRYK
jgi:XXXCH domain-containing protein